MQDIQEGKKIILRVCRRCIYEDNFKIGHVIDFQLSKGKHKYCPMCHLNRPVPYQVEVLVDEVGEENDKIIKFRGYLQGNPKEIKKGAK